MADDGPELEVKITTEADVGGVDEAARSLDGFKKRAGEAASEMRHLTGSSREGEEILRGLGAAGRGGAAGIGEMVRGLRSLALVATHIIGEGPLGVLLIALGLIGGAFLAMKGSAKEAGDETKKMGEESEKAAKKIEAIKKAVDESFKPLEEEMKLINDQFALLKTRIDDAAEAAKRLSDSQRNVSDSGIELQKARELDVADTPDQKEYIEKKYAAEKKVRDAQHDQQDSDARLRELQVKQAAADDEAAQKASVAQDSANKVSAAQKEVDDATRAAKRAVSGAAEDEATATADAHGRLTRGPASEFAAKGEEARKARRAAMQSVTDAREKLTDTQKKDEPIRHAADEAKSKADEVAAQVEAEQVVATNNNTAALNKVAEAIIGLRDVDKASISGSDEKDPKDPKVKAEHQAKETRGQKEADAAAAENQTVSALHAASKGIVGIHKAVSEHAKTIEGAHSALSGGLKKSSAKIERQERQMVNAGSYDASP